MGHWGKIFGTVAGAVFGGPLGAGVGAAVGAMVDGQFEEDEETDAASRPSSTRLSPSRKSRKPVTPSARLETVDYGTAPSDGVIARLVLKGRIPAGAVVVWTVRRPDGRCVKSRAPQYADDSGDLVLVSLVAEKTATIFLPYGALKLGSKRECQLFAAVMLPGDGEPEEIGTFFWDLDVPTRPWRPASQLASLVGLAMGMARADGRLDPAEVRSIREFFTVQFDLEAHADDLRAVMKQYSAATPPIEELLEDIEVRHPGVDKSRILEFLVEVARADGTIDPAEVEYVRTIYAASGGQPEAFDQFLESLEMVVEDLYAPFGLKPGATLQQVRDAFRREVQRYHPDRYCDLPKEFQEVARVKTAELNDAYHVLSRRLAATSGRD